MLKSRSLNPGGGQWQFRAPGFSINRRRAEDHNPNRELPQKKARFTKILTTDCTDNTDEDTQKNPRKRAVQRIAGALAFEDRYELFLALLAPGHRP